MSNENVINIYFSADANYFSKCIIAVVSLLKNHKTNEKLSIHILHSDLTEKELKIAKNLKADCNFETDFVYVEPELFQRYSKDKDMKYLSVNAFYRFCIPVIAPKNCKKALYLDCDLIVNEDISLLYNQDITGFKAGVVQDLLAGFQVKVLDLKSEKYFNSGVILMNLEELRKGNLIDETYEYFSKNKDIIEFHDQDILNGIWDEKVKFLDEKFNAQSYSFLRMKKRYKQAGVKRIKNPVIIHYTGSLKPWQTYCPHKKAHEWLKYQQLSPFKLKAGEVFALKLKRLLSKIIYISKEKKYKNRYTIFIFGSVNRIGKKI